MNKLQQTSQPLKNIICCLALSEENEDKLLYKPLLLHLGATVTTCIEENKTNYLICDEFTPQSKIFAARLLQIKTVNFKWLDYLLKYDKVPDSLALFSKISPESLLPIEQEDQMSNKKEDEDEIDLPSWFLSRDNFTCESYSVSLLLSNEDDLENHHILYYSFKNMQEELNKDFFLKKTLLTDVSILTKKRNKFFAYIYKLYQDLFINSEDSNQILNNKANQQEKQQISIPKNQISVEIPTFQKFNFPKISSETLSQLVSFRRSRRITDKNNGEEGDVTNEKDEMMIGGVDELEGYLNFEDLEFDLDEDDGIEEIFMTKSSTSVFDVRNFMHETELKNAIKHDEVISHNVTSIPNKLDFVEKISTNQDLKIVYLDNFEDSKKILANFKKNIMASDLEFSSFIPNANKPKEQKGIKSNKKKLPVTFKDTEQEAKKSNSTFFNETDSINIPKVFSNPSLNKPDSSSIDMILSAAKILFPQNDSTEVQISETSSLFSVDTKLNSSGTTKNEAPIEISTTPTITMPSDCNQSISILPSIELSLNINSEDAIFKDLKKNIKNISCVNSPSDAIYPLSSGLNQSINQTMLPFNRPLSTLSTTPTNASPIIINSNNNYLKKKQRRVSSPQPRIETIKFIPTTHLSIALTGFRSKDPSKAKVKDSVLKLVEKIKNSPLEFNRNSFFECEQNKNKLPDTMTIRNLFSDKLLLIDKHYNPYDTDVELIDDDIDPTNQPFTHLVVSKNCKGRTLRVLIALAYSLPIIDEEWIYASLDSGYWLPHSNFRYSKYNFFAPVPPFIPILCDIPENFKSYLSTNSNSAINTITYKIQNDTSNKVLNAFNLNPPSISPKKGIENYSQIPVLFYKPQFQYINGVKRIFPHYCISHDTRTSKCFRDRVFCILNSSKMSYNAIKLLLEAGGGIITNDPYRSDIRFYIMGDNNDVKDWIVENFSNSMPNFLLIKNDDDLIQIAGSNDLTNFPVKKIKYINSSLSSDEDSSGSKSQEEGNIVDHIITKISTVPHIQIITVKYICNLVEESYCKNQVTKIQLRYALKKSEESISPFDMIIFRNQILGNLYQQNYLNPEPPEPEPLIPNNKFEIKEQNYQNDSKIPTSLADLTIEKDDKRVCSNCGIDHSKFNLLCSSCQARKELTLKFFETFNKVTMENNI